MKALTTSLHSLNHTPPPDSPHSAHTPMDTGRSQPRNMGTSIHITALDGIVNVNSLFTLAVFIGLAWNPNDAGNTLVDDARCAGTAAIAESLVSFHVYSFSSFLFSSLVALALKQAIRVSMYYDHYESYYRVYVHRAGLRAGMLVSAVGSVCGCGCLMLALIDLVQIKLGILACGSFHSFAAVVPLLVLVPLGLLIYVFFAVYAFTC